MPRRVRTALAATLAFQLARARYGQPGAGASAFKLLRALEAAPRRLQDHPYSGAPSEEFHPARQLVVSGYRLIYTIDPDTGDTETAGDILLAAILAPGEP